MCQLLTEHNGVDGFLRSRWSLKLVKSCLYGIERFSSVCTLTCYMYQCCACCIKSTPYTHPVSVYFRQGLQTNFLGGFCHVCLFLPIPCPPPTQNTFVV